MAASDTNISPEEGNDPLFSEIVTTGSIGPEPIDTASELGATTEESLTVWKTMDKFDAGLKNALISFINTRSDGTKLAPTESGRSKAINFQFKGSPSSAISPGEIGFFSLVFSYPPGANVTDTDTGPDDASTL